MDGKHLAKVSKRGISGRKRAKIKNPYGRTDGRSDNVKTVSPQTQFAGGTLTW